MAAVAIDPAATAPAMNAAATLLRSEKVIFIRLIMPNFPEYFLLDTSEES
jgi:hypothetical protein